MKYILTILVLSFSGVILAQEKLDSLSAVVRDADTGEPIPYANVYVSAICGTLSNDDGEFCLSCLPSETISIFCIGYQRVSYRASNLPAVISLRPISTTLKELTISRGDGIIYQMVDKLQREAKKHRRAASQYFFRMAMRYPGTDELAEAFLSAKSCVQIRDLTFHSGHRGQLRNDLLEGPSLTGLVRTNMHIFLRLSPVLVNYDIWNATFVPADIVFSKVKNLYELSCVQMTEEDGTEISKVRVTANPTILSQPILDGTMYIDRKRNRLLRFDGQVHGLQVILYDQSREQHFITGIDYSMHVDYRHDHGFTEIANMSGVISKDSVKVRLLLYNLGDKKLTFRKSVRVRDNMMSAIDEAGIDSTLWIVNNIVKRTQEEERIAFKDSTFWSANKSKYNTPLTEKEQRTNQYLNEAIRQLMDNAMPLRRTFKP
ncbi:MAG: carboxypeptidase-like regulatory domain-containing protein [Bacteroidaceae bacterium]|nr:carboxypeptidase-like regulatory domain-containing protein [Bacteroidaceae bacterium]